jgi:hypothetical protein
LENRYAYKVFVKKKREAKRPLEGLGVAGGIILKCIIKMYNERLWTGFTWLRIGTSGALLRTR